MLIYTQERGVRMPKYIPNSDDTYNTKPCPVCGCDIVTDNEETCSDICDQQWRIFKEDYDRMLIDDLYKEVDE